jgi:hypothetical protein
MHARQAGARHCDPEPGKGKPGSSCRLTSVAVVESANQEQFDDFALIGRFNSARWRAILFQKPMCTMTMIVAQAPRGTIAATGQSVFENAPRRKRKQR